MQILVSDHTRYVDPDLLDKERNRLAWGKASYSKSYTFGPGEAVFFMGRRSSCSGGWPSATARRRPRRR